MSGPGMPSRTLIVRGEADLVQIFRYVNPMLATLFIHGDHVERYGFKLVLTIIIPFLLIIFVTKDDYGLPASQAYLE